MWYPVVMTDATRPVVALSVTKNAGNVVDREFHPPSCCSIAYWVDVFWSILSIISLFFSGCCDVRRLATCCGTSADADGVPQRPVTVLF